MKKTSGIWGIAVVLFVGCTTLPTKEQAIVSRFAECRSEVLRRQVEIGLAAEGYSARGGGIWQKDLGKKKDPLTGLIPVSDEVVFAARVKLHVEESAAGSLATFEPAYATKGAGGPNPETFPMRPDDARRLRLVDILETAVARARFAETAPVSSR